MTIEFLRLAILLKQFRSSSDIEITPSNFLIKVFIICFFFLWLRATFPRLRYDQLMKFCWKVLFPLALFNIMVMALWIALDLSIILASVMNILVAGAAFIYFNYSPYFES